VVYRAQYLRHKWRMGGEVTDPLLDPFFDSFAEHVAYAIKGCADNVLGSAGLA